MFGNRFHFFNEPKGNESLSIYLKYIFMLLILREYFKSSPIKLRIVQKLYDSGISISNGKLKLNDIEISVSEVARAFSVNRKSVYDTIRSVEANSNIRNIMERIRPRVDDSQALPLTGSEVLTIIPKKGCLSKSLQSFMDAVSGYICHLSRISASLSNETHGVIVATFRVPIPNAVINEIGKADCIDRIVIQSPDLNPDTYICPKCEVKNCEKKMITALKDL